MQENEQRYVVMCGDTKLYGYIIDPLAQIFHVDFVRFTAKKKRKKIWQKKKQS